MTKAVFKWIGKAVGAGLLALGLLCLFCFFYYNVPVHYTNDSGATEYKCPAFPQDPAVKLVAGWTMRKDVRDDRVLVFSKKFKLEAGHEARTSYPVRAVSAGAFVLPGASVEGMYDPRMHSRRAPGRVVVRH